VLRQHLFTGGKSYLSLDADCRGGSGYEVPEAVFSELPHRRGGVLLIRPRNTAISIHCRKTICQIVMEGLPTIPKFQDAAAPLFPASAPRRQAAGVVPKARLKARLNAAPES
jgi:hypothetical protein